MRSFTTLQLLSLIPVTHGLSIQGVQVQSGKTQLLGNSFGNPGENRTYDYVIVGGGTAGNTLASRLALDPAGYSVAIVETGTFYELSNGNRTSVPGYDTFAYHPFNTTSLIIDYDIVTEPQPGYNGRQIHYSQGRAFAGSSALNYQAYHRPTAGSLDLWAETVNDSSYKWENVLPFYKKPTTFSPPNYTHIDPRFNITYNESAVEHSSGPLQLGYSNHLWTYGLGLAKGFEAIGIKAINGFNSGKLLGHSPFTSTIDVRSATRSSSETSFLQLAMAQTSLKIYHLSTARKVLFDEDKKATGVEVSTIGSKTETFTLSVNKEVIVSAGAYGSPKLLMASGIGPTETLTKFKIPIVHANEAVGQEMHDQTWYGLSYKTKEPTEFQIVMDNPEASDSAAQQWINQQDGPLAGVGGGDMVGWEKLPEPYRSKLSNSTLAKLAAFPSDWPEAEYVPLASGPSPANFSSKDYYITVGTCLTAPLSYGNMTVRSADTRDPPIISPNWMLDIGEQELAVQTFHRVREWVAASEIMIDEYQPGTHVQSDSDILEWIKNNANLIYHASASCKMGAAGDPKAVLDSKARVVGVKNLRVVDASAFPFLPPGHPQSTVYMLAEKIAQDILESN